MRVVKQLLALEVAVTLASGCELAGTTAPAVESRVVVHAVLNPASGQQTVLVERTLRSVSTSGGGANPYEPIGSARVVIYGPRQDSAVAVKVTGNDGAYRVQSVTITDGSAGTASPNVLRLRPGERYQLRIETTLGVVTGETIVPVSGGPIDGARRTFNVDRDTLWMNTGLVREAAGYLLRHESRFNVEERFSTSLEAALILPLARVQGDPNEAEWSFSFARELMFPGVPQNFIVVAVDSNYFRYYVAGFDPFGDDTRGNTLTGGVGLFGSVATLMSKTLDLTADLDTPIEGIWTADRNSATMPLTMTLYSSPFFPGARPGGGASLSGNARLFTGARLEAYGSTNGNGVSSSSIPPGPAGPGTPLGC